MQEEITAVIEPIFIVGPLKARLPDSIIAYLNDFCQQSSTIDYSPYLAGKITDGRQLGLPVKKLAFHVKELVMKLSNQYLVQLGNSHSLTLQLNELWMVEQMAGDFNPVHQHSGILSGIIYLQIPSQCNLESKEGCIDFIFGRHMPSSADFCGQRTVLPVVGDIYIFPSWLQHVVYPFKGDGKRLSLAFNIKTVEHPADEISKY